MTKHPASRIPHPAEAGFTYVGVLVAVALIGVSLAVAGEVWQTTVQRERERELLFVGDQIRQAITQYYESTPGTGKQLPKSLEDMLSDNRYPTTRRYLRQVYRDPLTGGREWGLVKGPGDGIMGVYSLSKKAPLKRANFPPDYESFNDAESFGAWQFAYTGAPAPALPRPASSPIPDSTLIGAPGAAPAATPAGPVGSMGAGRTGPCRNGAPG